MEKTKLLLVFGRHGNEGTKASRFFRAKIVPFLEEEVKQGGKKAAIVYESTIYHGLLHDSTTEEDLRALLMQTGNKRGRNTATIDTELKRFDERMAEFRVYSNRGHSPPVAYYRDFGVDDVVLKINRAVPGRILHFTEPHSAEVVYHYWAWGLASKEYLRSIADRERSTKALTDSMREFVQFTLERDRLLFPFVESLRREDPNRAIIIPRGDKHSGMSGLYTPDKYDAVIKIESSPSDFMDDLIDRSYRFEHTEKELRHYGELQSHYLDFVNQHHMPRICGILDALRLHWLTLAINERLMENARTYAFTKVESASYIPR
ncbi:MAG: hypothetical protein Q8R04_01640 [Nanoarchaeota archaeon]|nr:hypothetical protein [Nanoarchaeota archaeon]